MKTYTPTIGIEVHAELKTKTKMFCGSRNEPHASAPNTHVCPVCLAHPGTLPVINKEAVRKVLEVGVALGGSIASFTEFDRKNYYYPDIPKGYQISQYKYPLVTGGSLAGVAITRVHLEEDTARSLHDQGEGSVVDYNRAGVPLMELVTEPVIHDAETAGVFARELQLLLRTLGVSEANMEKGEMRVELNISVSDTDTLGTKVEVKNINSFKSVEQAITYEVRRQTELLERGDKIIQETRGWEENKCHTFLQRTKETAEDYRYFPDPDLPKLDTSMIDEFTYSRISENMAETPQEKRLKYKNLGIPREQIEILIGQHKLDMYMSALLSADPSSEIVLAAANYLTSDVQAMVLESDLDLDTSTVGSFAMLMEMLTNGDINSRVAKDLLSEVVTDGIDPRSVAKERNLLQMSSREELLPVVDAILSEHTDKVVEYKSGKEALMQFFVGQGMKETKGSANPEMLKELFAERMNSG